MALAAINVKRPAYSARSKILLWAFREQAQNGATYFLMVSNGSIMREWNVLLFLWVKHAFLTLTTQLRENHPLSIIPANERSFIVAATALPSPLFSFFTFDFANKR